MPFLTIPHRLLHDILKIAQGRMYCNPLRPPVIGMLFSKGFVSTYYTHFLVQLEEHLLVVLLQLAHMQRLIVPQDGLTHLVT